MDYPNLWPCGDCGRDTAGERDERGGIVLGTREYYDLLDPVWIAAQPADSTRQGARGHPESARFLCIGCLEARLGRELTPQDFNDTGRLTEAMIELESPRLRKRRGVWWGD